MAVGIRGFSAQRQDPLPEKQETPLEKAVKASDIALRIMQAIKLGSDAYSGAFGDEADARNAQTEQLKLNNKLRTSQLESQSEQAKILASPDSKENLEFLQAQKDIYGKNSPNLTIAEAKNSGVYDFVRNAQTEKLRGSQKLAEIVATNNVKTLNKPAEEKLAKYDQDFINDLGKKNANLETIANSIQAATKQLQDPEQSADQKLSIARGMLKTLNSSQGADAISSEEAKRLGSLLEYHVIPNLTNPGPIFGRAPISEFAQYASSIETQVRDTILKNQERIKETMAKVNGGATPEATPVAVQKALQITPAEDEYAQKLLIQQLKSHRMVGR